MKASCATSPLLSVVSPAYCEAENIPILFERLRTTLDALTPLWEWIIVDDHSSDATPQVLARLAECDPRIRVIRFARNHGAYTAIACGLQHARGDAAIVLCADLQDPPEIIPDLIEKWRGGVQVVWAARRRRSADAISQRLSAGLFHRMIRRLPGMHQLPAGGADFFLLDRRVIAALVQCDERSVNLTALISWMGFAQDCVYYDRGARLHGQSGWNFDKKIKYAIDSVTAFSYLPIRMMSYFGVLVAVCGFVGAIYVLLSAIGGSPVRGYPSLMIAVLVLGGMQMVMLGVLGEYLWRTYDEVRGRPRFIIERTINLPAESPPTAVMVVPRQVAPPSIETNAVPARQTTLA